MKHLASTGSVAALAASLLFVLAGNGLGAGIMAVGSVVLACAANLDKWHW